MKHIYLFLDDERVPTLTGNEQKCDCIFVVRNVLDAKKIFQMMENKNTAWLVSFDHDLGEDKETGYDFAKFLVEYDMDHEDNLFDRLIWQVHSQNPIGASNINGLLENYISHMKDFGDEKV